MMGKETCPVFLSRRERPGCFTLLPLPTTLGGRGQRLGEGGRREKTHYHYAWIEEAGAVCPVIDFQETCCYNEGNQLTRRSSFGETTDYTYDANGSLVKETTVSPEGSGGKKEEKETFYHYDLLNRQGRVEGPEGRRWGGAKGRADHR